MFCVCFAVNNEHFDINYSNIYQIMRKKMHEIIEQNIVELNSIIQQNIEKRVSLSQLDALS